MNIGIIDADLIGRRNHNFPNLACMKISGYHKGKGDEVRLIGYEDKGLIIKKLTMFKSMCGKIIPKLYVLCGFDREGKYDHDFWYSDLIEMLERIKILFDHGAIPYIMKYKGEDRNKPNPFAGIYDFIGNWANQTQYVKKMSLNDIYQQHKEKIKFKRDFPHIADTYFDMKLKI